MSVLRQVIEEFRQRTRDAAPVDLFPTSNARGIGAWMSGASKTAALSIIDWNSTVYAIVEAQATAQARIGWRLWRKARSGRPEDRTEVTTHPALNVWNRPNRFYTQADLIETLANHYELTGEQWIIPGRSAVGGMVTELWPIRPDRMRPIPHPREFISGYVYQPGGTADDAELLGVDDVIWEARRHPMDPYRGMSPITAAMLSARADREAERYNAEFFENDASPGGLMWLPNRLPQPQFDEVTLRWDQQHRGRGRRHRIHFMDNMKDAKYEPMAYTRKDMQFTELHQVSVEGFMRAYRISDFVLGMLRDVNRAAAEAAMVWFGITHVIPRADRTRDMLNAKLLPLFGPGLSEAYEFDYDDPIPPDRAQALAEQTTNLDNALKAIEAGVPEKDAFSEYGLPDWTLEEPEPTPAPAPQLEPVPAEDDDQAAAARGVRPAHALAGRRRRARSRVHRMRAGL